MVFVVAALVGCDDGTDGGSDTTTEELTMAQRFGAPTDVKIENASDGVPPLLTWSAMVDAQGLQEYVVYRTGYTRGSTTSTPGERVEMARVAVSANPQYVDVFAETRVQFDYAVSALYRDGSESELEQSRRIVISNQYVCPGCSVPDTCGDALEHNDSRSRAFALTTTNGALVSAFDANQPMMQPVTAGDGAVTHTYAVASTTASWVRMHNLTGEDHDWFVYNPPNSGTLLVRTVPNAFPEQLPFGTSINVERPDFAEPVTSIPGQDSHQAVMVPMEFGQPLAIRVDAETIPYDETTQQFAAPQACFVPYALEVSPAVPGDLILLDAYIGEEHDKERTRLDLADTDFRLDDATGIAVYIDSSMRLDSAAVDVEAVLLDPETGEPFNDQLNEPILACEIKDRLPAKSRSWYYCKDNVEQVANGEFFVEIRIRPRPGSDTNPFTNSIVLAQGHSFQPRVCGPDDDLENNDLVEHAQDVFTEQLVDLRSYDDDWYKYRSEVTGEHIYTLSSDRAYPVTLEVFGPAVTNPFISASARSGRVTGRLGHHPADYIFSCPQPAAL